MDITSENDGTESSGDKIKELARQLETEDLGEFDELYDLNDILAFDDDDEAFENEVPPLEDDDVDYDVEEDDVDFDDELIEGIDVEICGETQIMVEHHAVVWCGLQAGHYPPTLHRDVETGNEWVQPTVHAVWDNRGKSWFSFTTFRKNYGI